MIRFSRPKKGEIRYLAFQDNDKNHFWLQKVEMIHIGKKWFQGKILEFVEGEREVAEEDEMLTGQYPAFCFLETEDDARKLLILDTFDTRDVHIFFRYDPKLEELL